SEPFSSRLAEEIREWAHEGDREALVLSFTSGAVAWHGRAEQRERASKIRCPVLVVSGTADRLTPHDDARELAALTGGELRAVDGGCHAVGARRPVDVNLAMRAFLNGAATERGPRVERPANGKRVLWWCSPLGLGHVRRDLAIAAELRDLVPGLRIN